MLADGIKARRKGKGMTQTELGKAVGLSQSYISDLENGVSKNPPIETVKQLAAALDSDVATLTGEAQPT